MSKATFDPLPYLRSGAPFRPGSERKVLVLIARRAHGIPLWHPDDAQLPRAKPAARRGYCLSHCDLARENAVCADLRNLRNLY